VPSWWHSIDLGRGVVTPGVKGNWWPQGAHAYLQSELESLALPDLRGRTVLDIGAWDGFYSFAAEQRGASRVVALDHDAWLNSSEVAGDPAAPPGRAGFDVARKVLGSAVEPILGDLMKIDVASIGQFDVVLFLGVLYHLEDPIEGMRRVARLTADVAIIESQAMVAPGASQNALLEFFPGAELNNDPSNWFVPNLAALEGLCRTAGFTRTATIVGPPDLPPDAPLTHYRAVLHAYK
jgi:tRNA (mo5U34)-methyltransferase